MPSTINLAYTAPINPSSSSPVLTLPQIWAGLQRKIRHAPEFVAAIKTCTVLQDTQDTHSGTVEREVVFAGETPRTVKEVCKSYYPLRVDFHQPDGGLVQNIVSEGKEGELYMTYAFTWLDQPVEEGTDEYEQLLGRFKAMSKMAVEGSIETIREMVRDGRIEK